MQPFTTLWIVAPAGSSVHGVSQARIPETVAISFSRGSSQPRDWTHVSCVFCIAGRFFTHWATWEAHIHTCVCIYIYITSMIREVRVHLDFKFWEQMVLCLRSLLLLCQLPREVRWVPWSTIRNANCGFRISREKKDNGQSCVWGVANGV